jgi:hypothetical protein
VGALRRSPDVPFARSFCLRVSGAVAPSASSRKTISPVLNELNSATLHHQFLFDKHVASNSGRGPMEIEELVAIDS